MPLDVGDRLPAERLAELVEQPRLADARLPDDPHDLAAPGAGRGEAAVEEIELLPAPDEARHLALDAQARPLKAKRHLGFITCNEESFYGRLSGWQNLAFFARLQNLAPKAAIPPVAKSLRLEPYLDRRFFSYSTGIKRRFDIARGLLHQPDILLLDEPTTNLDPITAAEVRELLGQLQARSKTVITVTHNLEEVRKLGRRLAIMRDGIFQEVSLAPEENLEELYRRVVLGGGGAA